MNNHAIAHKRLLEKTPEQKQAYRVRLKGVDAPEKEQYGYSGAKYFLEKLIWGEMVTVQYSGRDRNGTILGLVLYGGTFVNYEMVKEGWAWYDKKYFDSRELESFEVLAKKAQKGLWAEANAIPPWKWKEGERGISFPKIIKRKLLIGSAQRGKRIFLDVDIMVWGWERLIILERQIIVACAGRCPR